MSNVNSTSENLDKEKEPARVDYQPPATWASDFQVLRSMVFANVQGETQVSYSDIPL